jgi:plasmid stabilization system protein ParE
VTLTFHPLAEDELIAAAKFYESRAPDLGASCIHEIERTLAEVAAHPGAGNFISGPAIRRRLTPRFPFAVVYECGPEDIVVIAIMHLRRRPGYWKRRRSRSQVRR